MRRGAIGWVVRAAALVVLAGCSGFPDPADLPGRYEGTNAPASLELGSDRWVLTSGALEKSGVYDTSGNRIAFLLTDVNAKAFDRYCRDRADVYEWRFEDAGMVLRSVGDVCDPVAPSVLAAGPWNREGEA